MTIHISVITVVRNGGAHLEKTLESVSAQVGVACEHVVVDGGSSDETLDIIRRHEKHIAWWISEQDKGIADAMNKGIAKARGEWLLFLNADDRLADAHALGEAMRVLDSADDVDIVGFPIIFENGSKRKKKRSRGFSPWMNFKTGLWHQGTFIRSSLFNRIGGYNIQCKIEMDYEFFLRAYRSGTKMKLADSRCISIMRDGGISSRKDWGNLSKRLREERFIHALHARNWLDCSLYAFWWTAYWHYRKVLCQISSGIAAKTG